MRTTLTSAAIGAAAMLAGACAGGPNATTYQTEMQELRQGCEARGGILTPTGRATGRPATEYACEIRNPSRITN